MNWLKENWFQIVLVFLAVFYLFLAVKEHNLNVLTQIRLCANFGSSEAVSLCANIAKQQAIPNNFYEKTGVGFDDE